jgi:hypothetical protein
VSFKRRQEPALSRTGAVDSSPTSRDGPASQQKVGEKVRLEIAALLLKDNPVVEPDR